MSAPRIPGLTGRLSISILLATVLAVGCGGSGGTAPSTGSGSGAVGPAAIDVSVNAGGGTSSLAASTLTVDVDPAFRPVSDYGFQHVYMEVVKIALLPASDGDFDGGDLDGDLRGGNDSAQSATEPERSGWVTLVPSSPTVIDLLKLGNGEKFAGILNHFDSVPAGTYNKVRVFYRNVTIVPSEEGEFRFHPTAHSHFDLHFIQGKELVVPVATDTTYPDSWVKFFRINLDVEGLKINIVQQGANAQGKRTWNGAKVILRPQIFVEFVPPILYSVAGRAFNVGLANTATSGIFDIEAVGRTIHAAYVDGTEWSYSDNVLGGSDWTVGVKNTVGFQALRNRAIVEAIGRFGSDLVFSADMIAITFPDERKGFVDNGWRSDNTFVIRQAGDNVVFPKPDRSTAYYDNAVENALHLHDPLDNTYIDNNVLVRARGYTNVVSGVPVGIDAFWISIGP